MPSLGIPWLGWWARRSNFKTPYRNPFFAPHHNLWMSSGQQVLLPSSYEKGNEGSRDKGCFLLPFSPDILMALCCSRRPLLISNLSCCGCDTQQAGTRVKSSQNTRASTQATMIYLRDNVKSMYKALSNTCGNVLPGCGERNQEGNKS